jgi:fumarylpyruvate hydrolase
MADYVFNPADPVSLPIAETDKRFPVRRIYCVGRNYLDHVAEMGGDIDAARSGRTEPVFFTKAAETLVESGSDIPFPPNTQDLHHEVELVVAMGPDGIFGYGVGIDMTRRDLQAKAKSKGGPWARAKNFHQSAPCSALTPADKVDLSKAHIVLRKNGDIVQHAALSDMIWNIDEIISHLKADMDLQAGDLIYTGTPAGVGPVRIGDELSGGVEGLERITVRFV